MEEETQEFILETFDKETVQNLLAVIFFSRYKEELKKGFEDY